MVVDKKASLILLNKIFVNQNYFILMSKGGLRSGTAPTMLCVGLGAAARICMEELDYDYKRISMLSNDYE